MFLYIATQNEMQNFLNIVLSASLTAPGTSTIYIDWTNKPWQKQLKLSKQTAKDESPME